MQTDHRRPFWWPSYYRSSDKTHIRVVPDCMIKVRKISGDIKMTKSPQVQTDRLGPCWGPFWLADQAHIRSLIIAIHI